MKFERKVKLFTWLVHLLFPYYEQRDSTDLPWRKETPFYARDGLKLFPSRCFLVGNESNSRSYWHNKKAELFLSKVV